MKAFSEIWFVTGALALILGFSLSSSLRAEDEPKPENPQATTSAPATPDDDNSAGYTIEKKDGKTYKYKKKATYDFEGASIDGLYNKPSGSYISNIKDVKGKSIIRIRENFDAEVIDSGRLVK